MRVLLIDSTPRRETIRQLLESSGVDLDVESWAQPFDQAGAARTDWHADTSVFLIHLADYWSFHSGRANMSAINAALERSSATVILYSGGGLNHSELDGSIAIVDDEQRHYLVTSREGCLCVLHDAVVEGDEPDWERAFALLAAPGGSRDVRDVLDRSCDAESPLALMLERQGSVVHHGKAVERIAVWADADILHRAMEDVLRDIEIEPLRTPDDLRRLVTSAIEQLDIVALMPRADAAACVRWVHLLGNSGWEGRCVAVVPAAIIEALPTTTVWGDSTSPSLDRLAGFSWLANPPDITNLIELLDQTPVLYREGWLRIRQDADAVRLGYRLKDLDRRPSPAAVRSLAADLRGIEWDLILSHSDARALRDAVARLERAVVDEDGPVVREIVQIMEGYNLVP